MARNHANPGSYHVSLFEETEGQWTDRVEKLIAAAEKPQPVFAPIRFGRYR